MAAAEEGGRAEEAKRGQDDKIHKDSRARQMKEGVGENESRRRRKRK